MRVRGILLAAGTVPFVLLLGALQPPMGGPQEILTEEQYSGVMKEIDLTMGGAAMNIDAMYWEDLGEVSDQLTMLFQRVQAFWTARQVRAAMDFSAAALAAIYVCAGPAIPSSAKRPTMVSGSNPASELDPDLSRMRRALCSLLALCTLGCGGGKAHQALWEPSASDLAVQAPDSFMATFETSAGDFVVAFYRDWAPLGVDRVYHLTRYDFYAGVRFFRIIPPLVQFGLSGQPALDSVWANLTIPDDPIVASNTRGTVSFAKAGPGSRNTQLFINRQDNPVYDTCCGGGLLPAGREGGERYGGRRFVQ